MRFYSTKYVFATISVSSKQSYDLAAWAKWRLKFGELCMALLWKFWSVCWSWNIESWILALHVHLEHCVCLCVCFYTVFSWYLSSFVVIDAILHITIPEMHHNNVSE